MDCPHWILLLPQSRHLHDLNGSKCPHFPRLKIDLPKVGKCQTLQHNCIFHEQKYRRITVWSHFPSYINPLSLLVRRTSRQRQSILYLPSHPLPTQFQWNVFWHVLWEHHHRSKVSQPTYPYNKSYLFSCNWVL